MELGLTNKLALITGGSKGIGLACARAFLAEGARVAIVSRSKANVETALASLPGAYGFTADLTREDEATTLLSQIETGLGPLDVLINSAGAARRTPPEELTPAAWHAALDAKFFSYINMIDPAVKLMAARKSGVIVNIIGAGGKVASPVHIAGGAANAALMLATAGLAAAYAKSGVRVVGLNPGLTATGRMQEGLRATMRAQNLTEDEALAQSVARIGMGRLAEPEEIAGAALFLASPKASYISGVTIAMDGLSTPVI